MKLKRPMYINLRCLKVWKMKIAAKIGLKEGSVVQTDETVEGTVFRTHQRREYAIRGFRRHCYTVIETIKRVPQLFHR